MKLLNILFVVALTAWMLSSCQQLLENATEQALREKRINDSLALLEEEAVSLRGEEYVSERYEVYERSLQGTDSVLKVRQFYSTGEKYSEHIYRNNFRNGVSTYYYKNGKVFTKVLFKEGRYADILETKDPEGKDLPFGTLKNGNGLAIFYNSLTGKKSFEFNFVNYKKNGTGSFYYDSGELKAKADYVNDSMNGEMQVYYRNGNLRMTEMHQHGKLEGRQVTYYANGKQQTILMWKRGIPQNGKSFNRQGRLAEYFSPEGSKKIAYYENGDIMSEAFYIKGFKTGVFNYFYPKKKLRRREMWKNDTLLCDKSWFENGFLESESGYRNGRKDGLCTDYYGNGKKKLEAEYKNDKKNGKATAYYGNGQLYFKGAYVDDEPEGRFEYWYESGLSKGSSMYKNGEIVSSATN